MNSSNSPQILKDEVRFEIENLKIGEELLNALLKRQRSNNVMGVKQTKLTSSVCWTDPKTQRETESLYYCGSCSSSSWAAGTAMASVEDEKKVVKEGNNLLGSPAFMELENGRFKCVETGHEMLAKDKDSYSQSKRCRLGLIDFALSHNKPPLNMFKQDPLSRYSILHLFKHLCMSF